MSGTSFSESQKSGRRLAPGLKKAELNPYYRIFQFLKCHSVLFLVLWGFLCVAFFFSRTDELLLVCLHACNSCNCWCKCLPSRLNVAEEHLLVKAKSKPSLKKVCSLGCLQ